MTQHKYHIEFVYTAFNISSNSSNNLCIECYSDAPFGNLPLDGYIIFVSDHCGNKSSVTWQSRKVRRVVKSTLATKTLALLDAADAGVFISCLIKQILGLKVAPSVKCYVNNKSLVDALHSTTSVEDKSLRINIAVLRDMMQRRDVEDVIWVKTAHQLANALTKKGACSEDLLRAFY